MITLDQLKRATDIDNCIADHNEVGLLIDGQWIDYPIDESDIYDFFLRGEEDEMFYLTGDEDGCIYKEHCTPRSEVVYSNELIKDYIESQILNH